MGGEELEPSPQLLGVITSVFLLRLNSTKNTQKIYEIKQIFFPSLWLFHSTEVQVNWEEIGQFWQKYYQC